MAAGPTGIAGFSKLGTGGNILTVSCAISPTQGNALLGTVTYGYGPTSANFVSTVSDGVNNAGLVALSSNSVHGQTNQIFFFTNLRPGISTITATFFTGTPAVAIMCAEFTGLSAFDTVNSSAQSAPTVNQSSSAVITPGAISFTNAALAPNLIYASLTNTNQAALGVTPGAGFTTLQSAPATGAGILMFSEYAVVGNVSGAAATFTWTSSASVACSAAAFYINPTTATINVI